MSFEEIFVPIAFNKNFMISNHGTVIRIKSRHKSKDGLALPFRPGGYKKKYNRVSINNKDYYVHRLVLEHFVGECPIGYQCAHLDGNPRNNFVKNLKWTTPKENSQHKIIHGTSGVGSKNSMALLKENDVEKIRQMYSKKKHPREIAKEFGIKNITPIATARTWKHVDSCPVLINRNRQIAKYWRDTSNDRRN